MCLMAMPELVSGKVHNVGNIGKKPSVERSTGTTRPLRTSVVKPRRDRFMHHFQKKNFQHTTDYSVLFQFCHFVSSYELIEDFYRLHFQAVRNVFFHPNASNCFAFSIEMGRSIRHLHYVGSKALIATRGFEADISFHSVTFQ